MKNYIGYHFKVFPLQPAVDILIAELAELGFESFVENELGVSAFILKNNWHSDILSEVFVLKNNEFSVTYEMENIEPVNWNEEWEKNFSPITVGGSVGVRAPFHKELGLKYEIVIEPKMSFGTGHHETTHLMVQHLLNTNLNNKTVLDMGCGTGILAIFSAMKGATAIDAIDIDDWCYENTLENIKFNNCNHIKVYQGDASLLQNQQYDVVIANINQNILLQDIEKYAKCLKSKGLLFLSGFYTENIKAIDAKASGFKLNLQETLEKNNWVALKYIKK